MKWLFLLACFASSTAFSQTNKNSVLDKLKKTDELMKPKPDMGRNTIVRGLNPRQDKIELDENMERTVITLRQDNMPCIIPNMNLFKVMLNVGSVAVLEHPIDPGIYLQKPGLSSK